MVLGDPLFPLVDELEVLLLAHHLANYFFVTI
jgi:hypothetical protein